MAYADANMITTVLRNLLSNAVKFTPVGGEIKVNCNEYEDKIKVNVIDNGIGIEEENIDSLFNIEKKYKTKGSLLEKGTGLGLLLCKEFIGLNGGEISVKSEIGKGSIFSFTLNRSKL